jgi:hypothetical protein
MNYSWGKNAASGDRTDRRFPPRNRIGIGQRSGPHGLVLAKLAASGFAISDRTEKNLSSRHQVILQRWVDVDWLAELVEGTIVRWSRFRLLRCRNYKTWSVPRVTPS